MKKLLIVLICGLLLTIPLFVSAQDEGENAGSAAQIEQEAATANDEVPQGISVLMLLLGIGGVVIVGGAMIARDNFSSGEEATA